MMAIHLKWLVAIFSSLLACGVFADQTVTYKDKYGAIVGTSTETRGVVTYKDKYGAPLGTATQGNNEVTYKDKYGSPVGTATFPLGVKPNVDQQSPPKEFYGEPRTSGF